MVDVPWVCGRKGEKNGGTSYSREWLKRDPSIWSWYWVAKVSGSQHIENQQHEHQVETCQNHRLRKWTYGCQGEEWEEGIVRKFGINMYAQLYLKRTTKDLLYSTGNSALCYVAAWMGGEFGRQWIHVYVWLSPFAIHLKL